MNESRNKVNSYEVAPFTGAWIETNCKLPSPYLTQVAPFAGAWIETAPAGGEASGATGRPLHGGVD